MSSHESLASTQALSPPTRRDPCHCTPNMSLKGRKWEKGLGSLMTLHYLFG